MSTVAGPGAHRRRSGGDGDAVAVGGVEVRLTFEDQGVVLGGIGEVEFGGVGVTDGHGVVDGCA
ncbi:hypothetical protein [Streptomyces gibsoniae]|uniref:hypothetical protein n=1 Tax=Streptomyces gibsoniae TaxID=3075529 RepID=UPI00288B45B1|nr:hypothetical protein [Streptomyces sp. DSM 41699]